MKVWQQETHRDVFILHIPYALEHATSDAIAQVLRCRLWVNVTEVYGPICASGNRESIGGERRIRSERPEAPNRGIDGTKRSSSGLCHKGLSRHSLGRLCSRLLRLGDVRTAVLAIVDTLPSPCGFGWQRVHNL
jgi:hypothetical protein